MKILITTKFETSYTGNNSMVITAKVVTDDDTVVCSGEDTDSWPDPARSPASAKVAVGEALKRMRHMLENATEVARKAGLL